MQNQWQEISGGITAASGFVAAGVEAGLKKQQKKDVALIFSHHPARAAAVFTQNLVKAAPLIVTAEHLAHETARAVVINSGNANACNGEQGMRDAQYMAEKTALSLGIATEEVLVASTGVIGVPLPVDKLEKGIELAARELSPEGGGAAAQAIMTTDTRPKEIALKVHLDSGEFIIGAMAKGSGMIHPNMATMLAFITTEVNITKEMLQQALQIVTAETFNMITVDGDTSTNDMVLLLSNCQARHDIIAGDGDDFQVFLAALKHLCIFLAREICRDGEGATKLVEIEVSGAGTLDAARKIAKSIANSNLVKTALFGEDANWGRILAAAGYSGALFNPETVNITLESAAESQPVASRGQGLAFSEELASKILAENEIKIIVDLGSGSFAATAWTCDLSFDYVKINADYRT